MVLKSVRTRITLRIRTRIILTQTLSYTIITHGKIAHVKAIHKESFSVKIMIQHLRTMYKLHYHSLILFCFNHLFKL